MKLGAKIRQRLQELKSLDWVQFESAMENFIEEVEPRDMSGADKKALVLRKLKLWIDDQLKFKGVWELISDAVIEVAFYFLSGWLESVFQRWKSKNAVANTVKDVVLEAIPVSSNAAVKRQSKKQEDKS